MKTRKRRMPLTTPAAEGGVPVREEFLAFSRPFIGREEKTEVAEVLDSGWLSTGPRTKQFEEAMASYVGSKYAIALSSCTAGLHLALVAAGIGKGDEVVTSPLTFPSTANVILQVEATPILADIRPDTYNIDPNNVEMLITDNTKAIIPVLYGGQPYDLDEIMVIAKQHGLLVIEDAATGIGSKYKERYVGGFEDRVTVFSFYANKVMTTGEGGMLLTDMDELAAKARMLSLHGMSRDAWKRYSAAGSWYFEIDKPGFKYNMTDIQAALGLCQLKRLEWFIKRREAICEKYDKAFSPMDEIVTPYISPHVRSSRYLYPILIDGEKLNINRNDFIEALKAENIGTSVHYIPVHLHPYYYKEFGYKKGDYPVTESVFDRLISLPLFPDMEDKDVQDVITAVQRIVLYYRH